MILFIGLWHLVALLGLIGGIVGLGACLGVAGLLQLLWGIADDIEQEKAGAEQRKRDRRSAGAKQGHATRRAKRAAHALEEAVEEDWRVRRAANDLTPDDAFVQRGDQ